MNQRRGAYTPQFRQQMVELVGIGRKPIELAKEFGCHESSISAWVRQAQLAIADIDRGVYADRNVIIARHPSEADKRLMKAAGRAERVTAYSFSSSTAVW